MYAQKKAPTLQLPERPMDRFLFSYIKKNLDQSIFKDIRSKLIVTTRRFKTKIKNLKFGRKSYFKTLCKNYYFFETLIKREIALSLKERQEESINRSSYEEVMKKDKKFKAFRKKISVLEAELLETRKKKDQLIEKLHKEQDEVENKQRKKEYLEKLMKKAATRREELMNLKRNWSQSPAKSQPKYLKIEEEYLSRATLEKSQRIFEALEQKSLNMKSISKEEIENHSKFYDDIISEAKRKRKAKLKEYFVDCLNSPSNIFKKAIQDERESLKNSKKSMLAKRTNYSHLIKELYPPTIPKITLSEPNRTPKNISPKSPKKRSSLALVRFSRPILKRNATPETLTPASLNTPSIMSKINSGFFTPKSHSTIDKKNYLNDLRLKRNNSDKFISAFETLSLCEGDRNKFRALEKIQKIEKIALVESEKARFKDNRSTEGAFQEAKANELLLESLKAKMKLLPTNKMSSFSLYLN